MLSAARGASDLRARLNLSSGEQLPRTVCASRTAQRARGGAESAPWLSLTLRDSVSLVMEIRRQLQHRYAHAKNKSAARRDLARCPQAATIPFAPVPVQDLPCASSPTTLMSSFPPSR